MNNGDPLIIDDQGNIISGKPKLHGQKVILPFVWPAAWLGTLFTVLNAAKTIIELQSEIREVLNDLKETEKVLKELNDLLIQKCKKS